MPDDERDADAPAEKQRLAQAQNVKEKKKDEPDTKEGNCKLIDIRVPSRVAARAERADGPVGFRTYVAQHISGTRVPQRRV